MTNYSQRVKCANKGKNEPLDYWNQVEIDEVNSIGYRLLRYTNALW